MVHQSTDWQFLFLSVCLSVVSAKLENENLSHPLTADMVCHVLGFISCGTKVVFMLVSSHVRLAR